MGIDLTVNLAEVMEHENVSIEENPTVRQGVGQDIVMQESAQRTAELEGRVVEAHLSDGVLIRQVLQLDHLEGLLGWIKIPVYTVGQKNEQRRQIRIMLPNALCQRSGMGKIAFGDNGADKALHHDIDSTGPPVRIARRVPSMEKTRLQGRISLK